LLRKGNYEEWLKKIERSFSRLASRPLLATTVLFLSVLLLRVAALPLLPVPTPGKARRIQLLLLGDTLAHGRLTNPTPPLYESFETFHEICTRHTAPSTCLRRAFSGARTKARESVDWSAAQRIVDGRRVLLGPARLDASRLGVPGRRAGRAKNSGSLATG